MTENSYGVQGVPGGALYGEYGMVNGEWTGRWFATREDAQAAADALDSEDVCIVSVTDEDDVL